MSISRTSRLVDDIVALERDFRYNLDLLKIRDTEIDRCNKTNRALQDNLDSVRLEIQESKMAYADTKREIARLESARYEDQERYKKEIEKLEKQIKFFEQNEIFLKRQHERTVKIREEQLNIWFREEMNAEKEKFAKIKQDWSIKHEKAHKNVLHLKEKLTEMVDKNMELQNKVRKLESQIIADSCFYQNEVENVQSKLTDLRFQLEGVNKENATFKTQCKMLTEDSKLLRETSARQQDEIKESNERNEKLKTLTEQLEQNTNMLVTSNKELRLKNDQLSQENDNLLKEIKITQTEKMQQLQIENEQLQSLNNQSEEKFQLCKRANEELTLKIKCLSGDKELLMKQLQAKSEEKICNITEHFSFDNIVQQNKILQDVIKEMKKNKMNCQQDAGDLCEAAQQINRLEELVQHLKDAIIINHGL